MFRRISSRLPFRRMVEQPDPEAGPAPEDYYTQTFEQDVEALRSVGFDIDTTEQLGSGLFGVVYGGRYGEKASEALDQDGSTLRNVRPGVRFACKCVDFDRQSSESFVRTQDIRDSYQTEKKIMYFADHPNITPLMMAWNMGEPEVFTHKITGLEYTCHKRVFLIMEYAHHGSIRKFMMRNYSLSGHHRIKLTQDVFRGLKYLHDMCISHNDIHSGNVLVFAEGMGYIAKWTDFGNGYWAPDNPGDNILKSKKEDDSVRLCNIWDQIWDTFFGKRSEPPIDRFYQLKPALQRDRNLDKVIFEFNDILMI